MKMNSIPKFLENNKRDEREKFVALSTCIKKLERSNTSNSTAHLKAIRQKKKQALPRGEASRRESN